ncbi:MAG: hypothetical protein ACMUIM_11390 [bacterium]
MAEKTMLMAQYAAQRMAFKQRKNVLQMDTWLEGGEEKSHAKGL